MTLSPPGAAAPALYQPAYEHDSCGVGFVATLAGAPEHAIVRHALTVLHNLDHRGAVGAEPGTGDGAGILTQLPDAFLRAVVPVELPPPGHYAAGTMFLPADEPPGEAERAVEQIMAEHGLRTLAWRDVPVNPEGLGPSAVATMPRMRQLLVAADDAEGGLALERRAWLARKVVERRTSVYPVSLSSRTLTYKGMLTTDQLPSFYPDLRDERFASRLAVVHSR